MIILNYLIIFVGLTVAQERSKYADKTADVSSINNLAYKSPLALDPKIRKALLNVLNRLEEQESKKASAEPKYTQQADQNYYFSTTPNPAAADNQNYYFPATTEAPAANNPKYYFPATTSAPAVNNPKYYFPATSDAPAVNNLKYYFPAKTDTPPTNNPEYYFPAKTDAPPTNNPVYYFPTTTIPPTTNNPVYYFPPSTNPPPPSADDIKWEFKTNDTFGTFDYYKVVTSTSTSKSVSGDERGALFFQIPQHQEASVQQESLNLQESKNIRSGLSELPSTKNALPGGDILFANVQNEINEQILETTTSSSSSSTNETDTNSTTPTVEKNTVEFFAAPLLTAFTLEQDERGLPQRITPLEVSNSELQAILRNKINLDFRDNRGARDQQKEQLQLQFRKPDLLSKENVAPFNLLQDEQQRIRYELESQYQQLQERKRQIEFEKERLVAEHEKARRLKFALERQQREQEYARAINQNEIPRPEVAFQKSVEPQIRMWVPLPTLVPLPPVQPLQPLQPFNAALYRQAFFPQPPIQQFQTVPHFNYPGVVDRQLQNLFYQTGLNQAPNQREDLNIVSKVLALNHEPEEVARPAPRKNESQGDSRPARTAHQTSAIFAPPGVRVSLAKPNLFL